MSSSWVSAGTGEAWMEDLSVPQRLNVLQRKLYEAENYSRELQHKLDGTEKELGQARDIVTSLTSLASRKMMLFERSIMILRSAARLHGYPSVDPYIDAVSKGLHLKSSADVQSEAIKPPASNDNSHLFAKSANSMSLTADETWLNDCLARIGDGWAVSMASAGAEPSLECLVKDAEVQAQTYQLKNAEVQTDETHSGITAARPAVAGDTDSAASCAAPYTGRRASVLGALRSMVCKPPSTLSMSEISEAEGDGALLAPGWDKTPHPLQLPALPPAQPSTKRASSFVPSIDKLKELQEIPQPELNTSSRMSSRVSSKQTTDVVLHNSSLGPVSPRSPATRRSYAFKGDGEKADSAKSPHPPVGSQATSSSKRSSLMAVFGITSSGSGGPPKLLPDAPLEELIRQQKLARRSSQHS